MPGCILRVGGTSLDPDAVLQTLKLRPYKVWHRGEPMAKAGRRAGLLHEDSGFNCDVSAVNGDLRGQLKDAEDFLIRYRTDFEILASTPSIDERQLDFGFNCRLGDKIVMQGEYLPVSFLHLVGQLRVAVALSLYPGVSE